MERQTRGNCNNGFSNNIQPVAIHDAVLSAFTSQSRDRLNPKVKETRSYLLSPVLPIKKLVMGSFSLEYESIEMLDLKPNHIMAVQVWSGRDT